MNNKLKNAFMVAFIQSCVVQQKVLENSFVTWTCILMTKSWVWTDYWKILLKEWQLRKMQWYLPGAGIELTWIYLIFCFTDVKGTLMQIWKSAYMFVFIQK